MQVRPALFTRPLAASSDFDRAVASFVSESNSAEGRSLKMRGIERLQKQHHNLTADHVRVIASFVNSSNGLEGRGLKLDSLARLVQLRPDLSPATLRILANGTDASETLEGRACKLRGFEQLLRANPNLQDDVLAEMSQLVCGSNGVEGYTTKFDSLARMLKTQPRLSAAFVRSLRGLVDESNSVAGRSLKLSHVEAMLREQPGLTPDMLGAAARYVNESNSLEGRGLKLGSLVTLLGRDPSLEPAQVEALASGVNACPGLPSRRVAVAGFEQVLQAAPRTDAETLREMGRFLSRPSTDEGRTEYTRLAVQVAQGDPQVNAGTFRHLNQATLGAFGPHDGTARAEVAYNDLLIARGIGCPVEKLATLTPPATAHGSANLGLPLEVLQQLRQRPELALAEESVTKARLQSSHFDQVLGGTPAQVRQADEARFQELWKARPPGLNGRIQLIGLGVGVAAGVGMLFFPAVRSLAFLGLVGGVFFGSRVAAKVVSRRAEKQICETMRAEMKPVKAYWDGQVQAQEQQRQRVESFLTADLWQTLQLDPNRKPPGSNVQEGAEAVVIGGVRVVRRRPDLQLPADQGPHGFDSAGASGAAT